MNYKHCDIVWVKFPFTDSTSGKLRPALIISNEIVNQTGNYLLMQITSKLKNDSLSFFLLNENFNESPLLRQSELRLHKIFIVHETLIESKITSVKSDFIKSVIDRLLLLLK